ncbi:hypothetical protein Aph02nite_39660 [Actinoplanes philippinensis]|nr:hypothetical protein Aph02nite_39660 [Actinoplanes philippinensis]
MVMRVTEVDRVAFVVRAATRASTAGGDKAANGTVVVLTERENVQIELLHERRRLDDTPDELVPGRRVSDGQVGLDVGHASAELHGALLLSRCCPWARAGHR